MLRSGKPSRVRAHAAVTAASGRETDMYQRYAVGLYREALFGGDGSIRVGVVLRRLTTRRLVRR
jgi:hypothetical protein